MYFTDTNTEKKIYSDTLGLDTTRYLVNSPKGPNLNNYNLTIRRGSNSSPYLSSLCGWNE